jgi:D-alanine transaminase
VATERLQRRPPILLLVIVHLNGRLIPLEQAAISPFDRGFIFGDGVYEGLRAFRGRIVAMDRHIRRMGAALAESRIDWDPGQLHELSGALIEASGVPDSFLYWQVTRGAPAPGQPLRTRTPAGPMQPTVFGYCAQQSPIESFSIPPTVTAAVRPDTRWTRGHLKSTSLLGNVLAAIEGQEQSAQDVILVRDGLVAEGSATNIILALPGRNGKPQLVTPSLDSVSILAGITRALLLEAVPEISARPVRVEELFRATEVMLVGSTSMVTSVTQLDGRTVGDGTPGPESRRLLGELVRAILAEHDLPRLGGSRLESHPTGGDARKPDQPCTRSQAVA